MQALDLPQIMQIEARTWLNPWTSEAFGACLQDRLRSGTGFALFADKSHLPQPGGRAVPLQVYATRTGRQSAVALVKGNLLQAFLRRGKSGGQYVVYGY